MYRTIIVPIDLSQVEKGRAIFERARKLADAKAKLVLVTVLEDVPAYVAHELPAGLLEQSRASAESELADIATEAGVDAGVLVRVGHPANEIMAVAEQENADLIIIASHRPGLQDYFIGSTAGRVVRHATCSVLVER